MARSYMIAASLCAAMALSTIPSTSAQALGPHYDSSAASESRGGGGWDALGGLYALLAQHDALGGHALARKSVRSPSRRLRFGRRSDPDMPPQAPLDEMEELMSLREIRTPVRLRFGRRSEEHAMPHIFPQELESGEEFESPRIIRAPLRLRFGRRSDETAVPHVFPQEEQERAARTPSMRLRFGRRADNNVFVMPFESTQPKDVKATGSTEDDRQQE